MQSTSSPTAYGFEFPSLASVVKMKSKHVVIEDIRDEQQCNNVSNSREPPIEWQKINKWQYYHRMQFHTLEAVVKSKLGGVNTMYVLRRSCSREFTSLECQKYTLRKNCFFFFGLPEWRHIFGRLKDWHQRRFSSIECASWWKIRLQDVDRSWNVWQNNAEIVLDYRLVSSLSSVLMHLELLWWIIWQYTLCTTNILLGWTFHLGS